MLGDPPAGRFPDPPVDRFSSQFVFQEVIHFYCLVLYSELDLRATYFRPFRLFLSWRCLRIGIPPPPKVPGGPHLDNDIGHRRGAVELPRPHAALQM